MQSKIWIPILLLLAGCGESVAPQDTDPASAPPETPAAADTGPLPTGRAQADGDPELKLQDPVALD